MCGRSLRRWCPSVVHHHRFVSVTACGNGMPPKRSSVAQKKRLSSSCEDDESSPIASSSASPGEKRVKSSTPTQDVHSKPAAEFVLGTGHEWNRAKELKILSYNVASLRAYLRNRKEDLLSFVRDEDPDILCLQETKLNPADISSEIKTLLGPDYESYQSVSTAKKGYSGTAIYSRIKPLHVAYSMGIPGGSRHDGEGRIIHAEFSNFHLINVYVPNSGAKLERLVYRTEEWEPDMLSWISSLEKEKPVILCGDLNCAHMEIDLHSPKTNQRSAGYTEEERERFSVMLNAGFVDTFRHLHPDAVGQYTYWGMRFRNKDSNKGWRLDYFVVSPSLLDHVRSSYIRQDVDGSDHCPVGLILDRDR